MSVNTSAFHPKFVAAMDALERIPQDQRHSNPAASDLIAQAMAYAPNDLQEIFRAKARDLGLMPEPKFYSEDGEPVYTTAQLARHLGISLEEANQRAQALNEDHPDLAWPEGSTTIYRRQ